MGNTVIASDRRERGNLIQRRYTLGLPQRFALRNDRLFWDCTACSERSEGIFSVPRNDGRVCQLFLFTPYSLLIFAFYADLG